jgi:hypothetical protein
VQVPSDAEILAGHMIGDMSKPDTRMALCGAPAHGRMAPVHMGWLILGRACAGWHCMNLNGGLATALLVCAIIGALTLLAAMGLVVMR